MKIATIICLLITFVLVGVAIVFGVVDEVLSMVPLVPVESIPEHFETPVLLGYGFIVTFLIRLVIALICMAISYALAPDPKEAKSATIEDIDVPTATVGRNIPVLFGKKLIKGPNVTWFGDFQAIAFKK